MNDSAFGWLIAACAAGLASSATLHALIAAFEQLPYEQEQRLAAKRRPDGRRTISAWLARDVDKTSNSASIAYAVAEAVALVTWAFLAAEIGAGLGWTWAWTVTAAVAVAAFLALMVERALPRQLARSYPLGTVRAAGPLAAFLITASAPLRRLVPALRLRPLAEASDVVAQAQQALESEDAELLESVVELGDTLTREVMVPRTDMVTIDAGTPVERAIRMFLRSGFSRVPVVGDNVDDLRGVLYLKDVLARTWGRGEDYLDRPVDDYMREALFVPESVPADDLLRTLQSGESHMAIVVDEFGGVAGLVTIEDALEEIVGELQDEHDAALPEPRALDGGAYLVPARMPLDELGELFGIEIDDDEVETAAGLLTKALGMVAIEGASAATHGLVLTADRVAGRRKRLAWIVAAPDPDAPATEEDD